MRAWTVDPVVRTGLKQAFTGGRLIPLVPLAMIELTTPAPTGRLLRMSGAQAGIRLVSIMSMAIAGTVLAPSLERQFDAILALSYVAGAYLLVELMVLVARALNPRSARS
jgi:hypothetical protein